MIRRNSDPTDYWKIESDFCVVDNHVAAIIGLNEAIVLRTIYMLCRTKKQNEGTAWWQGKREYWLAKFPWLSERSLKRVFANLQKFKLIDVRVDTKNGNHYRPNQERIEYMLRNDDFVLVEHLGQNGPDMGQNGPDMGQNGPDMGQNGPALLSLDPKYLSYDLSYDNCTATAGASEDASTALTVIEPEVPKPTKPSTAETWEIYAYGYERRYGVAPLRNAKVNGQLKQFCERVGYSEAPAIIAFYLTQNDFWYVKQMHTIGIALAEAEKITAAYRRGAMVTKREAEYIDKTSSKKSFIDQILEVRRQKAEKGGT